MTTKKRGYLFIILGIVLIIIFLLIAYLFRENQKKDFDKLYNSNKVLSVEFGIIPQKKVLMEKNALFKKIDQENYYYLHITEDNILFAYYLDWYYSFDPMRGYKVTLERNIDSETVKKIMADIKSQERENLTATVESEYVALYHDDKQTYIKKLDLHLIFQKYDIILDI